ncbi:MAG TPA: hypothetical protein VF179_03475 [Thermoanaerobaculia bacterium]|nr:hypothetical protein [Thermoanaerobaculia bacterium]
MILEVIGLHFILDQLIPGQGTIYVHAAEVEGAYPVAIENIAIEIVPVKFAGHVDFSRVYRGAFSKRGIYPALVLFRWGEHRVYLRAYDRSRPSTLLEEDYINVSPYVRVGFWDKHVYLNLSER